MIRRADWPIYYFNGGTARTLSTFGIYVVTGSGASPNLTIPSPGKVSMAGQSAPVYWIKNKGTGTVTMVAENGGSFSVNNVAVSPYTILPGRSAMITWDGAHYNAFMNDSVSTADRQVPVTGGTITLTNSLLDIYNLIVDPAGTLATLNIVFPTATLRNGQTIKINSTQTITTLAMSGGTINNAATTLSPNTPLAWVYNAANTTWYRTT